MHGHLGSMRKGSRLRQAATNAQYEQSNRGLDQA